MDKIYSRITFTSCPLPLLQSDFFSMFDSGSHAAMFLPRPVGKAFSNQLAYFYLVYNLSEGHDNSDNLHPAL